ncbi:MAG: hypothetical protein HQK89_01280 [Nitrospirae bacterium]|nr:hypothetical protein [Nitrospirota bacterium]
MSQLYDITLKKTIKNIPKRFLKILTGFDEGEFLDTNFPTVQNRIPDIVIKLPDISIFHLELESNNENNMVWRMHDYYSLIFQRDGLKIRQILLYVGNEPLRMADRIQHETLNYSCVFKDIRDIDCSELLDGNNNPDDAMLAILCKMKDTIATLRAIRERFMLLPEKEQKDYLVGLKNLARLRGLTSLVKTEVEDKMPVTIDISNDETYLAGKREGKEEGLLEGLLVGEKKGMLEGEKRGLLEGEKRGLLEGEKRGLLEGIEVALDIKYGYEGLFLMDDIRKIGTIEKLEAFKEAVRKAASVNELMRFLRG